MTVTWASGNSVPLWLEDLPGDPPPFVWTRPQTLPFDRLTSEVFEKLVLRLIRLDSEVEYSQQYGLPGEDQHGIDLYCRLRDAAESGRRYWTVQCRNVATATATELALAVEDFLEGAWARKTDLFVFAMRPEAIRRGHAEAVEAAAERLRQANVRFELWDGAVLSDRIRAHPGLVDLFFGPDAVRQFCGIGRELSATRTVGNSSCVVSTVRAAIAQDLGVHRSIEAGAHLPDLTTYVYRKHDDELRRLASSERRRGELIVLVGGSSSGKTRSAFELIQQHFSSWALFHPTDAEDIRAFSRDPVPNCVVWLDELQRYVDAEDPLTVSILDSLRRNARASVVLLATLWAKNYQTYMVLPTGPNSAHRAARELLRQASIVDVADELTSEETERATAAAVTDPRIRMALDSTDYGMTQVLAAAPYLIRRWLSAPDPCAKALITAAIDAQTIGGQHLLLTRELLRSVVPSYLSRSQRARAATDWFDQAIDYAIQPLHGSASVLAPLGEEMATRASFVVADYVLQQGSTHMPGSYPPAQTWYSCIEHAQNGRSLLLIGLKAEQAGLPEIAERAHVKSEALGNSEARYQLVRLTEAAGRYGETERYLRKAVAEDDLHALPRLAEFIERHYTVDAAIAFLEEQDDTDVRVVTLLSKYLERQGRLDDAIEVWRYLEIAPSGLPSARIAEILQRNNRQIEAAEAWWNAARRGVEHAWARAARLFSMNGKHDQLASLWNEALHAGVPGALGRLVRVLQSQRKYDEAHEVLVQAAATGVRGAAGWLADIVADQGHQREAEEILRAGVIAGDAGAREELVLLLHRSGRAAEARDVAAAGGEQQSRSERWNWIRRLRQAGRVDDAIAVCQKGLAKGEDELFWHLVAMLEDAGRAAEAIALHEQRAPYDPFHYRPIGGIYQRLGDYQSAMSAYRLAVAADVSYAWQELAWLLEDHGTPEELEETLHAALAAGNGSAMRWLAWHLIDEGRHSEVNDLFAAGTPTDQDYIIRLLEEYDETSAIERYLTEQIASGSTHAGHQLSGILERQERIAEATELWRKLAQTDQHARVQLADLLEEQGLIEEAAHIITTAVELGDDDAFDRARRFFLRHQRIDALIQVLQLGVARGVPGTQVLLASTLQRYGWQQEATEAWRAAAATHLPLAGHLEALSGNRFDERLTGPQPSPSDAID